MLGNVTICENYQELNNFINLRPSLGFTNECKVIVIDDSIIQHPDYVSGSILLPTPSSVIDYVDTGDMVTFRNSYISYLTNTPEVNDFILVLMSCIVKQRDLIFYYNDQPLPFMQILSEFLLNKFGLIVNNCKYNPPIQSIHPNYLWHIYDTLFQLGYINQTHLNNIYRPMRTNSIFKDCRGGDTE